MNQRRSLLVKLGIALAIAAAGIFALESEMSRRSQAVATTQNPPGIPAQDLGVALIRVGLNAKNLTAAGVSTNNVAGVLDSVRTQLANSATALAAADESCASLRGQVEALERKIQSGKGQEQDVSNLVSARTSLATAQASQQSGLNVLHNAGVANLNENQKAILASIRVNCSWELPTEYLTVTRTQAQWVALRNALANERINAAQQQEPSVEAQALLAQVRADNTVSAAAASLIANLAAATTAWNQALNP